MEKGKQIAHSRRAAGTRSPAPLVTKLYAILEDTSTTEIVSWGRDNISFVIWNPDTFVQKILSDYRIETKSLQNFIRQLNAYGFRKVNLYQWEFAHKQFLRGQEHLLKSITLKQSSKNQVQRKYTTAKTCIKVGTFGLSGEIKRLERDNNVIMQEVLKLRQHQQNSDHQLHKLRERLLQLEHQQQMMSSLTMYGQSPDFFSRLVEQNGDSRFSSVANKKTRSFASERGGIGDWQSMLGGSNNLCLNSNDMSHGVHSSLPEEGSSFTGLFDYYLDELSDSGGQMNPSISGILNDFKLSEQDFRWELH